MNKKPHADYQRFTPVMDWWVATLVTVLLLLLVFSIPLVIWSTASLAAAAIFTVALISMILLVVDRAFFMAYYLGPEGLTITGQLREVFIPYGSILKVKPAGISGLISFAKRKRFSLSRHCLLLTVSGHDYKTISLSPRERQAFLAQLLDRIHDQQSDLEVVKSHRPRAKKKKAD